VAGNSFHVAFVTGASFGTIGTATPIATVSATWTGYLGGTFTTPTATINITAVNDAPVVNGVTLAVAEGGTTVLTAANFNITDPDSTTFTYTVTGTQAYDYDKVDMAKVMTTSVPVKAALNFMTCSGRLNESKNQFEQRTVVVAVQET